MKHLLLALLLSLPWLPAQAQEAVPTASAFPYRYAVLVANDRYFSARNRLALDYGQAVKGAVAEPEMAEMAKNINGSTSVVDALNYLARHGWELLSTTNVPGDASGSTSQYISSETRYLHRRRLPAP
ncbi:hypothetical protein [Hymenobacter arcticus]